MAGLRSIVALMMVPGLIGVLFLLDWIDAEKNSILVPGFTIYLYAPSFLVAVVATALVGACSSNSCSPHPSSVPPQNHQFSLLSTGNLLCWMTLSCLLQVLSGVLKIHLKARGRHGLSFCWHVRGVNDVLALQLSVFVPPFAALVLARRHQKMRLVVLATVCLCSTLLFIAALLATQTAALPATQTAALPATQTAAQPAQTAAQPATQTAALPATQTAAQPATQTAAQPATQTAALPATQTAAQPAQTAAQPATQTAAQPATQTAAQPATQTAAPQTAAQPATQTAAQPATQSECNPDEPKLFLEQCRARLHVQNSSYQFPSVDARVEYYMGGWSKPGAVVHFNSSLLGRNICPVGYKNPTWNAVLHKTMILNRSFVSAGALSVLTGSPRVYVSGVASFLARGASANLSAEPVVLVWFGDGNLGSASPLVVKARAAFRPPTVLQPVLWPLNAGRHFGPLNTCPGRLHTTAWEDKINALVWRGERTGKRKLILGQWARAKNLTTINVGFTGGCLRADVNCSAMQRPRLSMAELTRYKFLLSVEGNDVASGLKWMLYSNSVVLMPPPTGATWAMEDTLVPFLHYIPLLPDLSDLVTQVQWGLSHPEESMAIACASTDFMERLWVGSQAKRDHDEIMSSMAVAYQLLFADRIHALCPQARPAAAGAATKTRPRR